MFECKEEMRNRIEKDSEKNRKDRRKRKDEQKMDDRNTLYAEMPRIKYINSVLLTCTDYANFCGCSHCAVCSTAK